jgi:hypothetical protein
MQRPSIVAQLEPVSMRYKTLTLVALTTWAVVIGSLPGAAQEVRTIYPDLSLQFVCGSKGRPIVEREIEHFLRGMGVRYLNLAESQREFKSSTNDTNIFGIDEKRRIFEFRSLPYASDRYTARLKSPPPTQRAADIERAVEAFISEGLGCEIRQATRQENGPEVKDLHDYDIQRILKLFHQAEEIREPSL